jgi:hypothetical protein
MTYRAYLIALDVVLRTRIASPAIRFDAGLGTWRVADREVRTTEMKRKRIRFQLFTTGSKETLAGSYSGTIGSGAGEVVQYLVYFLQTGKPWHQGMAGLP